MNIKKYFWGLNEKAIKEVKNIIRNPEHPMFVPRFFTLLSRCDNPKEVFSLITKEQFVEVWPKVRRYWIKMARADDFRFWWETVYEQLLEDRKRYRHPRGESMRIFKEIGVKIRDARIKKGWSQLDLAQRVGISQPDISAIEKGKKNITLETLIQLCRVLNISTLPTK